jgi:Zn-dependent peptidase ImmA (M78 family)
MNKTGILGYYNPFTAESQYNPNIPATQLPFTLAHEMSHQLGYAREQEASFIAYLYSKKQIMRIYNIALSYIS